MNRKERRKMQADLGLNKYYKSQNISQRNKRVADNIKSGKEIQESNLTNNQSIVKKQIEEKYNEELSTLISMFIKTGMNEQDSRVKAQRICDEKYGNL